MTALGYDYDVVYEEPSDLELRTYRFMRGEYDPSFFNFRDRLEIERQMAGRPRGVKRLPSVNRHALDLITADLEVASRTSLGRRSFQRVPQHILYRGCRDLSELVAEITCGPEGENFSAGLAWCLRHAHEDQTISLVVVAALRPAIERIITLVDLRGRDEFVVSDVLTELLERLPSDTNDLREFVGELLRATRRSVRRRRSRGIDVPLTALSEDEELDARLDPACKVCDFLAAAVSARVITHDEAELLLRTYVYGDLLEDVATELNVPYKTLQSRRLRCIPRLAGFLRREGLA